MLSDFNLPGLFGLIVGISSLFSATLSDVAVRRIPNRTCVILLIAGTMIHLADNRMPQALASSLLISAPAILIWYFGIMGGGDVKLLGAAACFDPHLRAGQLALAIALAGGMLSLLYLALRHLPAPVPLMHRVGFWRRILRVERRRIRARGPLPYGVAIAAGCVATLLIG